MYLLNFCHDMPRGAITPCGRVSKWRPFFLRCFFNLLLSFEATEAMILSCFLAPQKWRASNMSFAFQGECAGGAKTPPLKAKGCRFGTLNACRQGVTTRESRVIACRNFPKSFFLLFSSPPTISPKNGAISNHYHHIPLCFLVRLRGVGTRPLK